MRSLHELPKFADRWSLLYLEKCRIDKDADGLYMHDFGGRVPLPIDQLSVLMVGPGSAITHGAVNALAKSNCLIAWVGQEGVRLYAHSTGGTFSSRRLLEQARLASNEQLRIEVARQMYCFRFKEPIESGASLEQIRGMEGRRVRTAYQKYAEVYGVPWQGRAYDQTDWHRSDPANRALSAANACLYGVCHAAIVSAGFSAAIGFIHTGKMLSFVYDIADLYKTDLTIPTAFRIASEPPENLERAVREACRTAFHKYRLMRKIIPDIMEVLGVTATLGESPEELEGKIVTLAD